MPTNRRRDRSSRTAAGQNFYARIVRQWNCNNHQTEALGCRAKWIADPRPRYTSLMDERLRRRFRFSLRAAFLVVFLVACLAWLIQWAARRYLPDDVFFHDFYLK